MQIIVDGMLTHYERAGKGRVVLILPGWADTAASWTPLMKELSKTYDVIVLNLPGFGGSQQPDVALGLDEYSRFVSNFLAKLGIKKVYAVIGHSNGGGLAIRALGETHITADKLVLLASAGIRAVQQGRKGMLRVVAKTGKVLSKPLPRAVQQKLRARLYTAAGSDMLVAEHMQETFKKIVEDDVQQDAGRLKLPTLLIYGDQDEQTPPRYGETFYKLIKGSELITLTGADHFLHVHEAAKVAEEIERFLG